MRSNQILVAEVQSSVLQNVSRSANGFRPLKKLRLSRDRPGSSRRSTVRRGRECPDRQDRD